MLAFWNVVFKFKMKYNCKFKHEQIKAILIFEWETFVVELGFSKGVVFLECPSVYVIHH